MANSYKLSDGHSQSNPGNDSTREHLSNAAHDQLILNPGHNSTLYQTIGNGAAHVPHLQLVSHENSAATPADYIPPVEGALSPVMRAIAEGRYRAIQVPYAGDQTMQVFVPTTWPSKSQ